MAEQINTISCHELRELMQESAHLVVINVLPAEMYEDCHITGSINIPVEQLSESVQDWNRDTKIVVYCAHEQCDASNKAYHTLADLGFNNIYAFESGMREWLQEGLPVEGPCQKSYL